MPVTDNCVILQYLYGLCSDRRAEGSRPHSRRDNWSQICARLCLCHIRYWTEGLLQEGNGVIALGLIFLVLSLSIYLLIRDGASVYAQVYGSPRVMARCERQRTTYRS